MEHESKCPAKYGFVCDCTLIRNIDSINKELEDIRVLNDRIAARMMCMRWTWGKTFYEFVTRHDYGYFIICNTYCATNLFAWKAQNYPYTEFLSEN